MRKILIFACLLFFASCLSKHSNDTPKEGDRRFTEFLGEFDSLNLPYSIIGFNDLHKYSDSTWLIKPEKTLLVQNPLLRTIKKNELEYVKSKYSIDPQINYFAIYKRKLKNCYLTVLRQSNYDKNEFWLKLNLFDFKGNILDTLTFAGNKVGYYNKYGKRSPDLHISTRSYHNKMEDTTNLDNYYATEICNEYSISKENRFSLLKTKKERAYFTDYGKDAIVARVDTLQR